MKMCRKILAIFSKCVFAAVLGVALLNGLCHALLAIDGWRTVTVASPDSRDRLPNYADNRETAALHFRELREVRTTYAASVGWRHDPYHGATININAAGTRTQGLSSPGGNQCKPVVFFGGSSMWGEGLVDAETIPAQFGAISGLPARNEAALAYTSRQSLMRFIELLSEEQEIRVAVFYDGINDVHFHCQSHLGINEHAQRSSSEHS